MQQPHVIYGCNVVVRWFSQLCLIIFSGVVGAGFLIMLLHADRPESALKSEYIKLKVRWGLELWASVK